MTVSADGIVSVMLNPMTEDDHIGSAGHYGTECFPAIAKQA